MKQTRKLAEGGLMIAMLCVIALLDRLSVGSFDILLSLLASLPIYCYAMRTSIRDALLLCFTSTLTMFFFAIPSSLIYMLVMMIVGLLVAYGVQKRWSAKTVYFVTLFVLSVLMFFSNVVFMKFFGIDPQETKEVLVSILQDDSSYLLTPEWIRSIDIIIAAFMALANSIIVMLLLHTTTTKLSIPFLKMPSLFDVALPKSISFCYIIMFAAYTFVVDPSTYIGMLVFALLAILSFLYFMIGYVQFLYTMNRKKKGRLAKQILIALVLGIFMLSFINIGIGMQVLCVGISITVVYGLIMSIKKST